MGIEFLGSAWFREAAAAVAHSDVLAEFALDHQVGITQVITDGPDGETVYHLHLRDGVARFGRGEPPAENIRFSETFDDAVRLARGDVNAQELLIEGRLRIAGDHRYLLDTAEAIAGLDVALAPLRQRTVYPEPS